MSVYRYQIRKNFTTLTGGTINPMISPATGTQQFTNYLTIYSVKPGQNSSAEYVSPADYGNNYFLKPIFSNIKQALIDNVEEYFTINSTGGILISSGNTIYPDYNYKNISIPINIKLEPTDYSEDIEGFVEREKNNSINPIIDGERVKYFNQNYVPVNINFRFYNKASGTFELNDGYLYAGFTDINTINKNSFRRSFFRLYFYDNNDTSTQNLLLTEDINTLDYTSPTVEPVFELKKIFWLKNDTLFTGSTSPNRKVYVEARFFNAKTGRVHRFVNTPLSITTPLTISQLANNQGWKSSKILILNPYANNGNRYFKVDTTAPSGANLQNGITFTEYILTT
jgi:hypothetical protein